MAADDNKAAPKTAGKSLQEPELEQEETLPPIEEVEAPKEDEMIVQQPVLPSAPSSTPAVPTESVRVVALCPIYYQVGFPPHKPGSRLSVCVVTARHWLTAGLIRLEPGEKLPPASRDRADFLVLSPGGTAAPASQG